MFSLARPLDPKGLRMLTLADDVTEFFAHPERDLVAPLFHRLIEEDPVHRSSTGTWIVTSHELARLVLRDNKNFVRTGTLPPAASGQEGSARALYWANQIVHLDEPDHTRLRALARHGFTPKQVRTLRDQTEAVIARRIKEARPAGRIEFISEISYPYTVEMISNIVGVPMDIGPQLVEWVHRIVTATVHGSEDNIRAADAAVQEAFEYLGRLADERRTTPGADLLTAFVQAEEGGQRLSRTELLALALEMVAAGHETTANMLPNAVKLLLQHPDQLDLVRNEPSLLPSAIEECLRYEPSVRSSNAYLTANDVELGGKMLPTGSRVAVWTAAANRDPSVFADPDRFDVTRSPNPHLSFSIGSHFCLGSALARVETEVALKELFTLPGLALDESDLRWRSEWPSVRALEALPLRWDS
jgi:cytochrome P450